MFEIKKIPSSLPSAAEKVFSGEIFDVYQWPQELYDGSTATFEKLKRKDTVIVIPVTIGGEILLLEQEQPTKPLYTSFAGGQIESEESVEEAAHRELLEETGYRCQSLEVLSATQPYSKIDWTIYTLIAHGCQKVAEQSLDPGERITVRGISLSGLLELVRNGSLHEPEFVEVVLRALLDEEQLKQLQDRLSY